jgi:hypothetical protein
MDKKTMRNGKMSGVLVLMAIGIAGAQQAYAAPATGFLGGVDAGPLIAALLALVVIAQGGRRRLRM